MKLLVVSICVLLSVLTAENGDLMDKIIRSQREHTNLSGTFVQEKVSGIFVEKIIQSGIFFFKNNGLLRWQYKQPRIYALLLNEKGMQFFDEKTVGRTIEKNSGLYKMINGFVMDSISGDMFSDTKSFNISAIEKDGLYVVTFIPVTRKMKRFITKIIIELGKDSLLTESVQIVEKGEDYTRIFFNDLNTEEFDNNVFYLKSIE